MWLKKAMQRTASFTVTPNTIYRGVRVSLTQPMKDAMSFSYTTDAQVSEWGPKGGVTAQLGPMILDEMEHYSGLYGSGLGVHWTTRRGFAESAADSGGDGARVVVVAEYSPSDVVPAGDPLYEQSAVWVGSTSEAEVLIKPGARLKVKDVLVSENWASTNAFAVDRDWSGGPIQGERTGKWYSVLRQPQQRTASKTSSVTINYLHNTEKAPAGSGGQYEQDIEPAGRYIIEGDPKYTSGDPRWESGTITFANPITIEHGDYRTPSSWKRVLSDRYDGKTGQALSDAIRADGHDGIITHDEYGTSEIVDLTSTRHQAVDTDTEDNGVMVCLVPPMDMADQLLSAASKVSDDLESLDEQHVTLLYLGDKQDVDEADLFSAVERFASKHGGGFSGAVTGYGTFQNPDSNVLYASWSFPGGGEWHQDLTDELMAVSIENASEFGWTPHETMAYSEDAITEVPTLPSNLPEEVIFGSVWVVYGSEWTEIPLG